MRDGIQTCEDCVFWIHAQCSDDGICFKRWRAVQSLFGSMWESVLWVLGEMYRGKRVACNEIKEVEFDDHE